eukprot:CAMPEP_0114252224 /NCGR_PEP_ID=MMETSP0058-20121206/15719_1 /TAXON_ID=36894 /ORGANISM="Pyramimonas parkeae, CCMP726" /LENGTH=305 /DNA_ID=CAMNT_0001366137 /DNA_START=380 /DNA_END=1295 /DNA_ORIENTATION=+
MNGMVVEEALRNAILERDLSMLKRILRTHGKQVTAIDMNGNTALHEACKMGELLMVKTLLDYGSDVQALTEKPDEHGVHRATPLHLAAMHGHVPRDPGERGGRRRQGADVHSQQALGAPHGVCAGPLRPGGWAHDGGVEVNGADEAGITPLHDAAYYGHVEIVRLLLSKGAKVTAVDEDGSTPLHHAAESGHEETVRALLNSNADAFIRNKQRCTALDMAQKCKQHAIVLMLRTHMNSNGSASDDSPTSNSKSATVPKLQILNPGKQKSNSGALDAMQTSKLMQETLREYTFSYDCSIFKFMYNW